MSTTSLLKDASGKAFPAFGIMASPLESPTVGNAFRPVGTTTTQAWVETYATSSGDGFAFRNPIVLWGERGTVGRLYDVMKIRREHAVNVTGEGLPAGHFRPEEIPNETLSALLSFLVE